MRTPGLPRIITLHASGRRRRKKVTGSQLSTMRPEHPWWDFSNKGVEDVDAGLGREHLPREQSRDNTIGKGSGLPACGS